MIYKKIKQYAPEKAACVPVGMMLAVFAAALLVGSYYCLYLFLRELVMYNDASGAIITAVFTALLFVANAVVYFLAVMATHVLAFRLETNLKKEGLRHLMNASFSFIDKNESGRIRKIIDDNTAMTHSSIAHLITDLTTALFTPLLGAALAFFIDWRLGVLFLVSYASGLIFIIKMMGNQDFMRKYMAAQDKMNSGAVEFVRGVHVLKVFKASISSLKDFRESIVSYSDLALKYSMSCRGWYVAFQVMFNAVFLAVLFFGYLGTTDTMEQLVEFVFYALFNGVVYTALNKVMYVGMYNYQAAESIAKIEALFGEMDDKKLKYGLLDSITNFDIAFRKVSFSYDDKLILDKFSFRFEEGKTYAMVGASGSGKSTIAKLASGFYSLDRGQILIGGHDIGNYTEEALSRDIANVFQDAKLFKKSIYDNVQFGRADAGRDEVMEALRLAQCDEILDKFEGRENTMIGAEGVHLSGGEIQRIAIARAILKDAGIVILDEASASADPENEHELQLALSNLMKGKTVIMIAHRLSSITGVDEILVVEDGKVIEHGTHDQLMTQNSTYKRLQDKFSEANEWRVTA